MNDMSPDLAQDIRQRHGDVVIKLFNALQGETFEQWREVTFELAMHLTPAERQMVLISLVQSQPHDTTLDQLEGVMQSRLHVPWFPTAASVKHDSEEWAGMASEGVLRAYAGAAVRQMHPRLLAQFKKWVADL